MNTKYNLPCERGEVALSNYQSNSPHYFGHSIHDFEQALNNLDDYIAVNVFDNTTDGDTSTWRLCLPTPLDFWLTYYGESWEHQWGHTEYAEEQHCHYEQICISHSKANGVFTIYYDNHSQNDLLKALDFNDVVYTLHNKVMHTTIYGTLYRMPAMTCKVEITNEQMIQLSHSILKFPHETCTHCISQSIIY